MEPIINYIYKLMKDKSFHGKKLPYSVLRWRGKDNETVFMLSLTINDNKLHKFLYNTNCFNFNEVNIYSYDNLMIAIEYGRNISNKLIETFNIDRLNDYLMIALEKRRFSLAKKLIEKTGYINIDLLYELITTDNSYDKLKFLLEYGIDANKKNSNGYYLINEAAREDNLKLMKLLVKHGADINSVDDFTDYENPGYSCIQECIINMNFNCISYLLRSKKINLLITNENGETVLMTAIINNVDEVLINEIISRVTKENILSKDINGLNAMNHAINTSNEVIIDILKKYYDNENIPFSF